MGRKSDIEKLVERAGDAAWPDATTMVLHYRRNRLAVSVDDYGAQAVELIGGGDRGVSLAVRHGVLYALFSRPLGGWLVVTVVDVAGRKLITHQRRNRLESLACEVPAVAQSGRGVGGGVKAARGVTRDWWLASRPGEVLACYDTLERDPRWWSHDWDELLAWRSVYELMRPALLASQEAQLARIDAWWRAHPRAFNAAFAVFHHQADRRVALQGYGITDDRGRVPAIPAGHWWWWPLPNDDDEGGEIGGREEG